MRVRQFVGIGWVALALIMTCAAGANAEVVGRLTQLEGRVNLMKGGNLPAVEAKLNDTVAPGDVIRTKSRSKAQITFIDNSTLTLSQESRVAIEEFQFEAAQEKRRAVLQIFQGLALTVVNKIIKTQEPDFIIKTQTAIVGVRGTEFGIRLQPNSSTILNFQGKTQVGNIFPEVSRLFRRAFRVAFSFGPGDDSPGRWVFLQDMQGTTVAQNMPPIKPFTITPQDQMMFMRQLTAYAPQARSSFAPGPTAAQSGSDSSSVPASLTPPGAQNTLSNLTTVTVPPTLVPQAKHPAPAPPVVVSESCGGGQSINQGY
jgi:hypothetical protein